MAEKDVEFTEAGLVVRTEREERGRKGGAVRREERPAAPERREAWRGPAPEGNIDLSRRQSIEDLTGGRIRKSG